MTTGATGQLGLALPVQGELSGTWGDTVNNGITQYTNIAIAGTLTLTGDGAVTLANTTGDASASNITSTLAGAGTVTAQFAIVKVSGTTTTKVVTGPSYSKTYVVDNASSYAVTFKASGQTGVSVAAAEKVTVVFNGTDYIKLAGTIANAAGSNTQIQFNNGGLFGASANLTWDGTTLSSTQVNITGQGTLRLQDTTGGEYVGLRSPSALGASYTLTFPADDGTSGQALITDGSGGLSWSTSASGDVYGPGSSTDNAVARFDSTTGKLLQNSVVIIGDTGDVTGVGTLSAATLTLTNALGTAYGGTGLTSFTSGGVVYASSTSALATGSALTYNATTLSLNSASASMQIGATGDTTYHFYRTVDNGNASFYFGIDNSAGSFFSAGAYGRVLYSEGAYPMVFYTNATQRMRITSAGDVGIGTSSPQGTLDVAATGATVNQYLTGGVGNNLVTGIFRIGSGSGRGASIQGFRGASSNIHSLDFYTYNSADVFGMRLDGTGLGIGTSSPAYKLDVQGATGTTTSGIYETSASGSSIAISRLRTTGTGRGYWDIRTGNTASGLTGALDFFDNIAGASRVTFDNAGNVGIGTSSPAVKLQVAGTGEVLRLSGTTPFMQFFGSSACYIGDSSQLITSGTAGDLAIRIGNAATNKLVFGMGATAVATLDSSGNLSLDGGGTYKVNNTKAYEVRDSGGTSRYALYMSGGISPTAGNDLYLGNTTANALVLFTNGTERARITSSGAFLVGTTSTIVSATEIAGFKGSRGISAQSTGGSANFAGAFWNDATTGDNVFVKLYTDTAGTERGSITYNRAGGLTVYNTTSDYRAKDILGTITDSGSVIDSVPVYMGKMKGATQERPMFIAHEVPAYAHTGEKDAVDADGNPVYQQMDASALIPVMWAEIQSLRKRLADAGI